MVVNEHLSNEILTRYEARKTSPNETLAVQKHIAACETCRTKLAQNYSVAAAFAVVQRDFAPFDSSEELEHLLYEQLEMLADDKMDEVDREIAVSHLAVCRECELDLADLQKYRQISESAAPLEIVHAAAPKSLWQRIFAFDSLAGFAAVAAVLLVAVAFGAWFALRPAGNEIVRNGVNVNQIPVSPETPNVNSFSNSIEQSGSPSPETSISPTKIQPTQETLYALNDGRITMDENGGVQGLDNLAPATQKAVRESLQTGKIRVPNHALGGGGGVLMSGGAENGVPFNLQTPIGKIVRENQPVLRWKPLADAESYAVAIVDEKFQIVAESGTLTQTNWKPARSLPRGKTYSWQVTATKADGTEIVSPASPAPQARFRVIEQNLIDEINRLEKSNDSPLALGVVYAQAGLKIEARREFEKLARQNPKSQVAKKLLNSVR